MRAICVPHVVAGLRPYKTGIWLAQLYSDTVRQRR